MSSEGNESSEEMTRRVSIQADSDMVSEKPLPAPPHTIDDSLGREPHPSSHGNLNDSASLPARSPPPNPPRLKKRVPWRGKNIAVLIPWDGDRGQTGKAPLPMTPTDVQKMLKDWEELGYNVSGFNLGNSFANAEESYGQSRLMWPTIDAVREERESTKWVVSIPDRRQWDAYVAELTEAKLRSLGVFLGDDEPAESPGMSASSCVASMQYPPLPFSPPIPTPSAGSSHAPQNAGLFSPALIAAAGHSTSQSSNISVASPAPMHTQMFAKFNSRASGSVASGETSFGSPPFSQISPGVWSPQILYQAGLAKGGSPSVHNLNPSFAHDYVQSEFTNPQRQPFNHQAYTSLSSRQSPRPHETHEDGDSSTVRKSPSKTPEPLQFIRHNPSDSLQKEIDDAEYHLEEQIQRQLDHDYSPHSDREDDDVSNSHTRNPSSVHSGLAASRFADDSGPVLHHPQPHSRGHSLSQRPFDDASTLDFFEPSKMDRLSEIETNPSHPDTPVFTNDTSHQRSLSNSTNPWADSDVASADKTKPKDHTSLTSISKLNVEAPEFKFNPTSTFQPSNFSFSGTIFQPPAPALPAHESFIPGHSVNNSFGLPVKGKINVNAAPFKPGQTEFNFSSSGPSFRPDAPSFTPIKSIESTAINTDGQSLRTSIFGKIDLPVTGIVKPMKKSKAIPIIRPDNSRVDEKANEDESVEDKDGRITQGEGRIKRARGAANDGDSIPLFAEPSPVPLMPLQQTSREQSPNKHSLDMPSYANKENLPMAADDELHTVSLLSVKPLGGNLRDISPDYDGKSWAPYEFMRQKDAEQFSSASAHPVEKLNDVELGKQNKDIEEKKTQSTQRKNTLSALAKPFEFTSWFMPSFGESKAAMVPPPAPTPPIKASAPARGLASSKYAAVAPPSKISPREAGESPVTTLNEEERSAFQDALPPRTPLSNQDEEEGEDAKREPLYEEIDAVMRQMNERENMVSSIRDVDTSRWQPSSPPRLFQFTPQNLSNQDEEEAEDGGKLASEEIDAVEPYTDEAENRISSSHGADTSCWHQPSPHQLVEFPPTLEPLHHRDLMRSDAPSPSPRRFQPMPGEAIGQREFTILHEDPFAADSNVDSASNSPIHCLNKLDDIPHSDWDEDFSDNEAIKLHARTQFFDGHVNDLVGGLLAERLDPLERALEIIQDSLVTVTQRSNRRDRRSVSGELPESDADDEDDENQRPRSPLKDKKLEKIKVFINEALASHQQALGIPQFASDKSDIIHMIEEFKEQFGQSMRLDLRGEDLRNIVEEVVERKLPDTLKSPAIDETVTVKIADLEAKVLLANQQVCDAKERTEEEIRRHRVTEDRLTDIEQLLRNASVEQEYLREVLQERDQKLQSVESASSATMTRLTTQEASAQKEQAELCGKINKLENELRLAQQLTSHWQSEAETAVEATKHHKNNMDHANETNAGLRRLTENLRLQMEESLRLREGMRAKLGGLQDDMAKAAREISRENAKRIKKEQKLLARQEVLDARLQAEARTRERLEKEILRLEAVEREGMRAVSESKRLEALLSQLRTEMHESEKKAKRAFLEIDEINKVRFSMSNEIQRLEALADNLRSELNESEQGALRNQREAEGAREDNTKNMKECQRLETLVASLRSELHESERTSTHYQRQYEEANDAKLNNAVKLADLESLVNSLRAELQESQLSTMRYQREIEDAKAIGKNEAQRAKDHMKTEIESANNLANTVRQDLEAQVSRLRADLERAQLDANTTRCQSDTLAEEAAKASRRELESLSRKHAEEIKELQARHTRDVAHVAENRKQAEQLLFERLSLSSAKTEHLQERVAHLEERLEISKAAALAAAQSARNVGAGRTTTPEKISPQALRESIMVLQEQLQAREQSIERLEQQLAGADPDAAVKMAKRDDEISWLRELLAVRAGDLQDIVTTLSQEDFDVGAVRDAAIRLQANLQMEQQERGRRGVLPNLAATLRDAATPRVAQVVAPVATAWGNWRRSTEPTPSKSSGPQSFLSGLLTPPAPSRRRDVPKPIAAPATPPMLRTGGYDPDARSTINLRHGQLRHDGYDDDYDEDGDVEGDDDDHNGSEVAVQG